MLLSFQIALKQSELLGCSQFKNETDYQRRKRLFIDASEKIQTQDPYVRWIIENKEELELLQSLVEELKPLLA